MSLAATLLGAAFVVIALFAAWGFWFGVRIAAQHRRVLARLAELEDQLSRSRAAVAPRSARAGVVEEPVLVISSSRLGLFAEFMKVLATLDHFQHEGRTPIVYFNRPTFLYWSDSGWNGARNGWEYYFHALSERRLEDVLDVAAEDLVDLKRPQLERLARGDIVFNDRLLHRDFDMFGDVRSEHRERYASLCARYIRVKDEVLGKVEEFAGRNFAGRRIVGLHFRSTDKLLEVGSRLENAGWDPDVLAGLEVDSYIDEALRVAGDDGAIFMATEDAEALQRARERLDERLICTNATRTRGPLPPFLADGDAEQGEEALIDCLLLARCDYLVHGVSNLSWAARMFNPGLSHTNVVAKLIMAA